MKELKIFFWDFIFFSILDEKDERSSETVTEKVPSLNLKRKTTFKQNGATHFVERIDMPGNGYDAISPGPTDARSATTGIQHKHNRKRQQPLSKFIGPILHAMP